LHIFHFFPLLKKAEKTNLNCFKQGKKVKKKKTHLGTKTADSLSDLFSVSERIGHRK